MDKVSVGAKTLLFPMPTVLVGANVGGKPNYMAVAWAGIACMAPPMVAVAINHSRHTNKGIHENKTFSVNIPSGKHVVETDYCGIASGSRVDKTQIFETFYGKARTAPLIRECPINMECELRHTLDLGSHELHVGEIIDVHVDNDCITDGMPDIKKLDPIIYAPGKSGYWHIGEFMAQGFSVGKEYKK